MQSMLFPDPAVAFDYRIVQVVNNAFQGLQAGAVGLAGVLGLPIRRGRGASAWAVTAFTTAANAGAGIKRRRKS